jgi:hypothetical protein
MTGRAVQGGCTIWTVYWAGAAAVMIVSYA